MVVRGQAGRSGHKIRSKQEHTVYVLACKHMQQVKHNACGPKRGTSEQSEQDWYGNPSTPLKDRHPPPRVLSLHVRCKRLRLQRRVLQREAQARTQAHLTQAAAVSRPATLQCEPAIGQVGVDRRKRTDEARRIRALPLIPTDHTFDTPTLPEMAQQQPHGPEGFLAVFVANGAAGGRHGQ